ncbi:MAG: arylsulfatase, partial [Verrucomicrobiae bacterium]|nr:arylsulfatase [Verrucomicrobiae bacterium]
TYPKKFEGHDIIPNEGVSLVPAFEGKSLARKEPIFIEHENNAFVRDGEWKLVGRGVTPPRGLARDRWELYHLSEDGTELNDLSSKMPGKVKSMSAAWEAWAKRAHVYPKPSGKKKQPGRKKQAAKKK